VTVISSKTLTVFHYRFFVIKSDIRCTSRAADRGLRYALS
jgi:hypothetical protein